MKCVLRGRLTLSTEQNEQNTWWATVQAQTSDSVELKGF